MAIYFSLWCFFFCLTFGVWVPAGVFVPGMLIGCSLGMLYLDIWLDGLNMSPLRLGGQSYLVIAAAGILSGYTRLTYSLAVVIMETTQSVNLFIPVLITIMISHATARAFNRSLYDYSIRGKQMPLLRNHVPRENRNVRVREIICNRNLETVPSVCTVQRLAEVLNSSYGYSTIAIVNMYGCLIGLLPKSFAIVLIKEQMWYETKTTPEGR